jgi:HAD superfamily hydrolase (TIGR01509 family)
MDGLLLDSERPILEAWQTATDELGVTFDSAAFVRAIGQRVADSRAQFRASLGADFPLELVRARVQALLAERRAREGFSVKPGARELLLRLAALGVPCAVASSTRREEVELRLESTALASLFGALVGGDEVVHGKPAPDTFLLAAERLRVAPAECLVFEDAEQGARAAASAGMQVVIVPDLKQPSDEARRFSLAVLDSLVRVDGELDGWFGRFY